MSGCWYQISQGFRTAHPNSGLSQLCPPFSPSLLHSRVTLVFHLFEHTNLIHPLTFHELILGSLFTCYHPTTLANVSPPIRPCWSPYLVFLFIAFVTICCLLKSLFTHFFFLPHLSTLASSTCWANRRCLAITCCINEWALKD